MEMGKKNEETSDTERVNMYREHFKENSFPKVVPQIGMLSGLNKK